MREITFEQIENACRSLVTTNIKGKEYVAVNERVKAFRMVYPTGYIVTDIVDISNGLCIMRATVGYYEEKTIVSGDGEEYAETSEPYNVVLATGTAYEKESSSYINKTSYIENCETSAIGRALGFAGFGIDTSIASANEVENAQYQQKLAEKIDEREAVLLEAMCRDCNVNTAALLKQYKVKSFNDLNTEQYARIAKQLEEHKALNAQPEG